jgi:hypothetical protein
MGKAAALSDGGRRGDIYRLPPHDRSSLGDPLAALNSIQSPFSRGERRGVWRESEEEEAGAA